jgi:hypothetical protein
MYILSSEKNTSSGWLKNIGLKPKRVSTEFTVVNTWLIPRENKHSEITVAEKGSLKPMSICAQKKIVPNMKRTMRIRAYVHKHILTIKQCS